MANTEATAEKLRREIQRYQVSHPSVAILLRACQEGGSLIAVAAQHLLASGHAQGADVWDQGMLHWGRKSRIHTQADGMGTQHDSLWQESYWSSIVYCRAAAGSASLWDRQVGCISYDCEICNAA